MSSFDPSERIGKNEGYARVQEAEDFKCAGDGQITYEINWKYTTNLSGKRKFIFTGKQLEGYSKKIKATAIGPNDIVIFRRSGHPNNGKRATVKRIIMPMTDEEIALAGLDKRKIPDFKKVYELEFKNIGSGPNNKEVKKVRTSKEEEIKKYINHRTLLCINLSKDYFKNIYLPEKRKELKTLGKKFDRTTQEQIINDYNNFIAPGSEGASEVYSRQNDIIVKKLEREMKMLFLKNKKFKPDYIYAWELKDRKENVRGNQLTMPDGTYYIMNAKLKKNEIEKLSQKNCGAKIEKIWVTVHITLRKEAMKIADDILLNGALFLNCAERKEEIWNVFGNFKKSSDKTLEKIFNIEKNKKGKRNCALTPIDVNKYKMEKEIIYEFGDEVEIKYDVELTNVENPWEGWVKAKIQNKRDNNKYEVVLKDSNISIDNVPSKYIRNLNKNLRGGIKRRKSRRKKVKRRRTRKKALRN
tara:strand:- start:294 stop:1703 length:1410 start_codon:yes stop_codon:yes gene_type:complete